MKTMNRILSVMLAILLTLGMAPTLAHAAPGELTEDRVTWEKLHFYYDGNGHCPVVTVLGIDDVVLTENEDYVLECGYYHDDGTATEFVPLTEYPVEIGVYICRLRAIGDYFNNEEIASEFEIEECPWGEPVKNGGVINYVDDNGTTSAEVSKPNADANGLIWLKEESGDASTWYGMDNSTGAFEEGSRFWVRWLREEEDPQAFAAYYAQLDDEHKNNINDGHLRIFLIGVTNPSGNEYQKLNQPVDCVFVDNWAGNTPEAVFISEQSDEAIETQPALSHFVPLDDGDEMPLNELLVSFPISHFSPYAVYEKKNDPQAKTGESVWWSYDDSTDTLTISDSPAEGRQEFTVEAQQWADVYNMPWNIPGKWYSKMKTVIIDGNPRPGYMNAWFCNAHDLTEIRNLRQLDTSCVTSMESLFNSCQQLAQLDLSGFQTANVTDFSGMFVSCDKLSALDLSSFDTTAATDLSGMFYSCDALTDLDISGFSIQNNINCTEMFMLCESLKTLKLFSVKSGCSMTVYRMFSGCSALETIYAPCTSVWPDRETGSHVFLNCDKLSGGKGSAFSTYGGYRGGMLRFDGGEDAPGYLTAMHDWKSHGMRKAFCTSEGYADYQCQRCLDTKRETIPINPDNHGYVVRFAGQNATCTEEGTRDYYRCNWCKKKYLDKACSEVFFNDADLIIPATGHAYVNHAAQTPTCTAVGWNAYQTCANCDYTTYKEITATGHTYVNHAAQTPTCTAVGWNAYQTCANCDYTSYSEISATGHAYVDHAAQAPTCTAVGWNAYQTCANCDYTSYSEIPATGHAYVDHAAQAPSCTAIGWNAYQTCANCDYTSYSEISATGHAYVDHAAQAPTCTAIGWNAYQTCANCDYTSYSEISATGHAYVDHPAQAPSCTAIGWNAYQTCANCDYTSYSEISATGHAYVDHAAQAPTCTAIGWNAYQTCANCDYTTYSEIPANGHTDGVVVIENKIDATCESSGSYDEVVYCADCGTELSRENVTVPATGHEDADNDGKCDHGGEQMTGDDHCRLCGKIHDKHTIRGVVTGWFHTLIYYAKTYVDPVLAILWVSFLTMLFP